MRSRNILQVTSHALTSHVLVTTHELHVITLCNTSFNKDMPILNEEATAHEVSLELLTTQQLNIIMYASKLWDSFMKSSEITFP